MGAQRMQNTTPVERADYDAVMKAIGISVNGFKRRINKVRTLTRVVVESGGRDEKAAAALASHLTRMESDLDVPDLTQHRMAKRENSRRSQQEVLEQKLADCIECIRREVPRLEWPTWLLRKDGRSE